MSTVEAAAVMAAPGASLPLANSPPAKTIAVVPMSTFCM
jgi:hypothetical protein